MNRHNSIIARCDDDDDEDYEDGDDGDDDNDNDVVGIAKLRIEKQHG